MKKKSCCIRLQNEVRQNKPNKLEQILENWEQPKEKIMMIEAEKIYTKRNRNGFRRWQQQLPPYCWLPEVEHLATRRLWRWILQWD